MKDESVESLRKAWDEAVLAHDGQTVLNIGQQLIHHCPKDLWLVWQILRHAGFGKNRAVFCEAHARFQSIVNDVHTGRLAFADHWRLLVDQAFDCGDIELGSFYLKSAIREGLVDPSSFLLWPDVQKLYAEYPENFHAARTFFHDAGQGRALHIDADVRVVGVLRFYNPVMDVVSCARQAWLTVTKAIFQSARKYGQSCVLLSEYLPPLVEEGHSRHIFSHHTTGTTEGTIHFKLADLPDYVIFDPKGYACFSSLAGRTLDSLDLPPLNKAEEFFVAHRHDVISGNISKYEQNPVDANPMPLPMDYVFVPMQILTDRTQSLAYVDMLEMLDMVIGRFQATPTKIVVKRHPRCSSEKVAKRLEQLSLAGAIILRDDSIHTLIENSRAVMTVNSGVGSETILHLKPIYVFGVADYDCIAHRIKNQADFMALTTPIHPAVSYDNYKRFLCYYRTRYMTDIRNPARVQNVIDSFMDSGAHRI